MIAAIHVDYSKIIQFSITLQLSFSENLEIEYLSNLILKIEKIFLNLIFIDESSIDYIDLNDFEANFIDF